MGARRARQVELTEIAVPSPLLHEDITAVALPPPAAGSGVGLPWLYLLHGRDGSSESMRPLLAALGRAMEDGRLPRHVVIAPDAPWSDRAGWWVDSLYSGPPNGTTPPGQPVESAVLADLLPAVERHFGAPVGRHARRVGGISMGGAGALRWALVHPGLFGAAVLLSPAAYSGPPPAHSSARSGAAFGRADRRYDQERYLELSHYPTLLSRRSLEAPPLWVAIVAGDREPMQGDGAGGWRDLDLEAAQLHAALKRAPGIVSSLRIVGGGHSADVWEREVVDALRRATAGGDEQLRTDCEHRGR